MIESIEPSSGAYTPRISWFEAGEAILGLWRAQVVALRLRVAQERLGHHGADHVAPPVVRACVTKTITLKACEGGGAALLERCAEHVEVAAGARGCGRVRHGLALGWGVGCLGGGRRGREARLLRPRWARVDEAQERCEAERTA